MAKTFRPYEPDQRLLLPPALADWVPEDHLARFVRDVVETLNLTAIEATYTEERGYPPYHPRMMVGVLLYAYATGTYSSRKIARRLVEDVAVRFLAAGNQPDFRTLSDFRKRLSFAKTASDSFDDDPCSCHERTTPGDRRSRVRRRDSRPPQTIGPATQKRWMSASDRMAQEGSRGESRVSGGSPAGRCEIRPLAGPSDDAGHRLREAPRPGPPPAVRRASRLAHPCRAIDGFGRGDGTQSTQSGCDAGAARSARECDPGHCCPN